jgi:hypothetical protein
MKTRDRQDRALVADGDLVLYGVLDDHCRVVRVEMRSGDTMEWATELDDPLGNMTDVDAYESDGSTAVFGNATRIVALAI